MSNLIAFIIIVAVLIVAVRIAAWAAFPIAIAFFGYLAYQYWKENKDKSK